MDGNLKQTSASTKSVVLDEPDVDATADVQTEVPENLIADTALTFTDVLTIMSNRRRRFIIHYLQHVEAPATIGELSTQIAAWELKKPVERVRSAERKNVYNALAQTHIRRLREHRFIHEQRGQVELTNEAQSIRIHLDIVPDKDVPWSQYYLGLGVLGLVISATVGALAPAAVPAGGWGIFVAVSVLVFAAAHWHYKRRMCIGVGKLPPELRYNK